MGKLISLALTDLPSWADANGGWTPPVSFGLRRDENKEWSATIDFISTLPSTRDNTSLWPRVYVDPLLGSDSNSGQTQALALRNVGTALTINSSIYGTPVTATSATPISIQQNGHGRSTGDEITITGATGAGAAAINNTFPANPSWVITVVDANNFTLNGSVGTGAMTNVIISKPRIVMLKPGATWLFGDASVNGTPWNGVDIVANTIVMPWDGTESTSEATLSMRYPPRTWTNYAPMTWVAALPSAPGYVFDLTQKDKNGNGRKYTNVADIASVDTTPYSWYYTGGNIYVNTNNVAVAPTSDLHIVRSTANGFRGNSKYSLWMSRLVFEYSDKAFSTPQFNSSTKMPANYTDRCRFIRATNQGGLYSELPCYWYHFGSTFADNETDGASYRRAKAVEIDCQCYDNGNLAIALGDLRDSAGTNSNQGSTIHLNSSIIRIGGRYYGNNQGIFDTSADAVTYTNAYSWNFGVRCYNQIGRSGVGKEVVDFGIGSTNTTNEKGFYFDCKNVAPDGTPSTSKFTYRQEQQGWIYTNFDLTFGNDAKLSGSRSYVVPI